MSNVSKMFTFSCCLILTLVWPDNMIKYWLKIYYRLWNDRTAGLYQTYNIVVSYIGKRQCIVHKGLFLSKELDIYVVFRGQLTNGCQWQHTISLMCKLSLLPCSCVEYQRGRFHAALCVCEGVKVQRRFPLDVFVIRGEARGLWVALGMDWLFRCRGSGGQRRELDSSNDAISPSVTGLALIRVSQDAIWFHHESLNWRRPFTRPQWQILLLSHCAGAQMTVNMQRWPALCASCATLQACVWIISLIHLVIDWSFWLLLSIPDSSRWQLFRVLK